MKTTNGFFRSIGVNGMLTILVGVLFTLMNLSGAAAAEGGTKPPEPKQSPHSFVVTYFHNTMRCPTCHKLETYSSEAVQDRFQDALHNGVLVWRVLNVDEPANQHYTNDYQLYTKSLILSEMKDGKEVRWKNLDKIWELVGDEGAFKDYVASEISAWMKGN